MLLRPRRRVSTGIGVDIGAFGGEQVAAPPTARRRRQSSRSRTQQQRQPQYQESTVVSAAAFERQLEGVRTRRASRLAAARQTGLGLREEKVEELGLPGASELQIEQVIPAELIAAQQQVQNQLNNQFAYVRSFKLWTTAGRQVELIDVVPGIRALPTASAQADAWDTQLDSIDHRRRGLAKDLFLLFAPFYFYGQSGGEVHWMINATVEELKREEAALFGVNMPLHDQVKDLREKMEENMHRLDLLLFQGRRIKIIDSGSSIRSQLQEMLQQTVELVPATAQLRLESDTLIRQTCSNREEPFTQAPVEEIDQEAFIQMMVDRQCYDVNSLIYHLRNVSNGQNEQPYNVAEVQARTLAQRLGQPFPPHRPIWKPLDQEEDAEEEDTDFGRLMNHPLAAKDKLEKYIESRSAARVAEQITSDQLFQLGKLANIMTSTGESFVQAAAPYFTEEEMKAWLVLRDTQEELELPMVIRKAAPSNSAAASVESRLRYKINELIKPPALLAFSQFVESQPQQFRDALEILQPGVQKDLRECQTGLSCVMVVGRNLKSMHDKIAATKPDYVAPE